MHHSCCSPANSFPLFCPLIPPGTVMPICPHPTNPIFWGHAINQASHCQGTGTSVSEDVDLCLPSYCLEQLINLPLPEAALSQQSSSKCSVHREKAQTLPTVRREGSKEKPQPPHLITVFRLPDQSGPWPADN